MESRAWTVPQNGANVGRQMHEWIAQLYPICRSITGDGLRRTLAAIHEEIPLTIHHVATGLKVLDWTVPQEWNIRDAYIKNSRGERIVDFNVSNLHVLNYSIPVRARLSLTELKSHLFSLPDHPDWIPYRTSYYKEEWGFCLTHSQLLGLEDDDYDVCIDSSLTNGHLSYGECVFAGEVPDEVLISCHVCHPSLCNDNLSGLAVATFLAQRLAERPHRYSYRFLFLPGTIGAITWLARNPEQTKRIKHGVVLTCLGDAGAFTYKKSRRGDAEVDRAVRCVLETRGRPFQILEFSPYGYDERQYCSPGFNLPVGCLMRSQWGTFPEYHTSADNLDFIKPDQLADSLFTCEAVVELLERNRTYQNLSPFGEPQLGKRGLYRPTGGSDIGLDNLATLWVLNLADGHHTLLDIAERSGIAFPVLDEAARRLVGGGLLRETGATSPRDDATAGQAGQRKRPE